MTIAAALQAMTSYPIAKDSIDLIADYVGLATDDEASGEVRKSNEFKKAQAMIYVFLAEAPNISQSGISYSFSQTERERFAKRASAIFKEIGEEDPLDSIEIECGYIGEDF